MHGYTGGDCNSSLSMQKTHLRRKNGECLGKHLEGAVPDGCFLFDQTGIFLIEYEDQIFIFVNIYKSRSVCEEENKVSNRTLCMLKMSSIFCALLTQPKWPEIFKCWERLTPFPIAGIQECYSLIIERSLSRGANSRHPWLEIHIPTTAKSCWADGRVTLTGISFHSFYLLLVVLLLLERSGTFAEQGEAQRNEL